VSNANELLISAQTTEKINIALLENKELVELTTERSDSRFAVGDIYLAKVKKIVSGLNAVFVDLGYERDAFLHYHDLGPQFSSLNKLLNIYLSNKSQIKPFDKFSRLNDIDKDGNIADVITIGQPIIVQISKEPISSKGPRLCSELSIAGRNIVLMPFSDKVSISQKIESDEEKTRLKKVIQSLKPNNYGVIVRTVAQGRNASELDGELKGLIAKWEKALKRIRNAKTDSPKLLFSESSRVTTMLRDILNPSFNSIVTDNKEIHDEILEYLKQNAPDKAKILRQHLSPVSMFEYFGINKQIRTLFGKNVGIKNGAYLIIEHTEAMHVIDVNSGNRTKFEKDQESNAFDVNSTAAIEIARQLRLRDMGGIIIIDFIDMRENENRSKLYESMKTAMFSDRAKHNILPLSKFGIMQITRQRVRPEMNINTNEVCPYCKGSGHISPTINHLGKLEDDIKHAINVLKLKNFTINVHPIIAGYLNKGIIPISLKWQFKYKTFFSIKSLSTLDYLQYEFISKGEKIIF